MFHPFVHRRKIIPPNDNTSPRLVLLSAITVFILSSTCIESWSSPWNNIVQSQRNQKRCRNLHNILNQRHGRSSSSNSIQIPSLPNFEHSNLIETRRSRVIVCKSSVALADNDLSSSPDDLSNNNESPVTSYPTQQLTTTTTSIDNKEASTGAFVSAIQEELLIEKKEHNTKIEDEETYHNKIGLQNVINALILLVCFGYAFYTIFTIDAGMTRGWNAQEIATRIPLDNWHTYEESLSAKPVETKTFINVVIYLIGDWLSQTLFQKKNVLDFDFTRTLKNGFIGLCFGPLVHLYYEWSDTILPMVSLLNKVEKIIMDQTIYLSIKCSIYIMAVGLLNGESIKDTANSVKERILPIMFTAWKFWPLVHCITYSVIPAQHRILWVNCVDLIWNAILAAAARDDPVSAAASSDDDSSTEDNGIINNEKNTKNNVMAIKDHIDSDSNSKNESFGLSNDTPAIVEELINTSNEENFNATTSSSEKDLVITVVEN